MRHALVVERDPVFRGALRRNLEAQGWSADCRPALSGELRDASVYRLALVGFESDAEVEALRRLRVAASPCAVVALVPRGRRALCLAAMKAGARDFLETPFDVETLESVLAAAVGTQEIAPAFPVASRETAMRHLLGDAERASQSDATIQIIGESGTGKDHLAHFVHRVSPRRAGPFVVVNCTALPESLAESELFGHCRGAFTGAEHDREGQLRRASGGTLVLDHVGELDAAVQPKLLRALQEREVIPVGSDHAIPIDIRIVASAQRPLSHDVDAGRFREDLYYRLDVISLHLPPLRERPNDVAAIAEHYLERFAESAGVSAPRLGPAAREALKAHPFPGNIRELENLMRRAVLWMPGRELEFEALQRNGKSSDPPVSVSTTLNLRELERRAVERALVEFQGVRVRAAEALGISERTLRNKIRLYELA